LFSKQENQLLPDEELIQDENRKAVLSSIDQLPDRCRQVFIMKKYDELTYNEIADILGISINTVKTQMKRAFKSLFEKLQHLKSVLLFILLGI